jgi:hypothetical protein
LQQVYVQVQVETGYNAIQRLLLDLERFGHVLHGLRVAAVDGDDRLMHFEAWVSGTGKQADTVLEARLQRHFGVVTAIVHPLPRAAEVVAC